VAGVWNHRQKCGKSICSKAGQCPGGCNGCVRPVSFVQEPAQFVESGHGSWPQDVEGHVGSAGELKGFWVEYASGKHAHRWKGSSGKPIEERKPPLRWVVLHPLQNERKSRNADAVNSVCCHVVPGIAFSNGKRSGGGNRVAGAAQHVNPVAEGMSGARRFARNWLVCDEGDKRDEGECGTDKAEEDYPLLSHAATLPRREADERAD
jgi:hypothetical protein